MNENRPSDLMKPAQRGMLRDLLFNVKLILRLMADRRVNPIAKILPIAAVVYFIVPLPIENLLPLVDDAAVLWLGSYLFMELCPPQVVEEHRKLLTQPAAPATAGEVVDAQATDVTDQPR
jgi:hypothetical protein